MGDAKKEDGKKVGGKRQYGASKKVQKTVAHWKKLSDDVATNADKIELDDDLSRKPKAETKSDKKEVKPDKSAQEKKDDAPKAKMEGQAKKNAKAKEDKKMKDDKKKDE